MKKRIISVLLAAVTASVMLVGCGNDGTGKTDSSSIGNTADTGEAGQNVDSADNKAPNDHTITMMCWYDESSMDSVIDEINRQLDGEYVVEYTYIGVSDYNNVLSTQLASGEGPDIIADGANFPARIKAGNVEDITDTGLTDGFSKDGLALCSIDGKVYGVPCYGWFAGVFYNTELFEQAGITQVPETFDEFLEVCEKLSDNGIAPLSLGLADGDNGLHAFAGFMESNFYGATQEGAGFDYDFAMGDASMDGTMNPYMENWIKMVENGYITPDMVGISGEQAKEVFMTGKAAIYFTGPWEYNNFKEAGLSFGVMPFPGVGKESNYLIGGPAASWGINVNSDQKEGAMKVMEALASVEVQQAFINENAGGSTYREGVNTGLPEEYQNITDAMEAGRIACCWDRWSVNMPSQSLIDEINSQVQGLVAGDLDVSSFLQTLDSKADSIRYE
ncbi:MAG: extracellular solute-binding protein [Lachnospiraceae bacterium]|nr:extracellular solute-binding protein [Lachnospiraceae bacterium]